MILRKAGKCNPTHQNKSTRLSAGHFVPDTTDKTDTRFPNICRTERSSERTKRFLVSSYQEMDKED